MSPFGAPLCEVWWQPARVEERVLDYWCGEKTWKCGVVMDEYGLLLLHIY